MDYFNKIETWPIILIILIKWQLPFLLSAIKWTRMEKAKFGLHSLNAEKTSVPTAAWLGTVCCLCRRTDGPMTCNGGRC